LGKALPLGKYGITEVNAELVTKSCQTHFQTIDEIFIGFCTRNEKFTEEEDYYKKNMIQIYDIFDYSNDELFRKTNALQLESHEN